MHCSSAASPLLIGLLAGTAAIACDNPRQMDGFKTCADVAKAEQEGALVVYSTDPEARRARRNWRSSMRCSRRSSRPICDLQAGALYAKLLTERQGRPTSPTSHSSPT